ncbi:MAG: hypothetical protein ACOC4K_02635, partial [Verrucomicrobiota bacterium]
ATVDAIIRVAPGGNGGEFDVAGAGRPRRYTASINFLLNTLCYLRACYLRARRYIASINFRLNTPCYLRAQRSVLS